MPDMIVYTIRTSQRLRFAIAALHLLASAALFLADVPWTVRTLLCGAVAVSLFQTWPRRREEKLRTDEKAGPQLWRHGEWQDVTLLDDSVVLPWMTLLSLRRHDEGQRLRLVILGDSLNADEFRRLRVWVKWKGLEGEAGKAGQRRV